MWEWQDATWHRLNSKDASILEKAYSQDPAGCYPLALGPHESCYEVDFVAMKQRSRTGRVRNLRRKVLSQPVGLTDPEAEEIPIEPPAPIVQEEPIESTTPAEMLGQEEAVAVIEPVVTLPALPVFAEQEIPEVPEATVPLPLEPELLAKDWTVELQEAVSRAEAVVEECGMSGETTQEEAPAVPAAGNFGSLEDLKRSLDLGHVVLVKGPWLALAMQPFSLGHADLPRRPELPPEAIWTQMEQLDETSAPQRLMVISHCFAEDDQEAATSLAALLRHVAFEDVGIFFDCCSLYQEPRSDEEELLFQKGLRDSCAWYASPFTTKWLLGPINDTRGWRLWERCMAQLMILRNSKKVFQVVEMLGPNDDLEPCHIIVTPQVTPDVFDVLVEEKSFGLHDAATAKAFYREAYFSVVSSLQWMDCSQNSWDDFHMLQLAEVLIHCNTLVKLILAENRVSDFGLETLTCRLPKALEILDLSQNCFGDDGLEQFSRHLPPRLRQLCLSSNQFGAQGLEALLKGLSHCEHLSSLSLARVPLGGACLTNFASLQALRHLCLNEAHLGCEGMLQLSLPKSLEELLLDDNALGDAGLRLLVPKLPLHLKLLSLSENGLRDSGLRALQPLRQLRTLRVNSNHLTPKALADLGLAISTEILALKQRPP